MGRSRPGLGQEPTNLCVARPICDVFPSALLDESGEKVRASWKLGKGRHSETSRRPRVGGEVARGRGRERSPSVALCRRACPTDIHNICSGSAGRSA